MILRTHADSPEPEGLRYYELRQVIGAAEYERLPERYRVWYAENTAEDGRVIDYLLPPGSYDAWVVEEER